MQHPAGAGGRHFCMLSFKNKKAGILYRRYKMATFYRWWNRCRRCRAPIRLVSNTFKNNLNILKLRIPSRWCGETAPRGAQLPLKWCIHSAQMVQCISVSIAQTFRLN